MDLGDAPRVTQWLRQLRCQVSQHSIWFLGPADLSLKSEKGRTLSVSAVVDCRGGGLRTDMSTDRKTPGEIEFTEATDLPNSVKALFWDVDPSDLRWDQHRDFMIGRILSSGPWATVQWLRKTQGDEVVRSWIERYEGRGLSPKQLRFWELILGIPSDRVDPWVEREERGVWGRRTQP